MNGLLREHLESAIVALPEAYRVVVVLGELEGFSYRQIAQMLDIPVGTVRSRLARGRAQLQRALWEDARAAGLIPAGAEPAAPQERLDAQRGLDCVGRSTIARDHD